MRTILVVCFSLLFISCKRKVSDAASQPISEESSYNIEPTVNYSLHDEAVEAEKMPSIHVNLENLGYDSYDDGYDDGASQGWEDAHLGLNRYDNFDNGDSDDERYQEGYEDGYEDGWDEGEAD